MGSRLPYGAHGVSPHGVSAADLSPYGPAHATSHGHGGYGGGYAGGYGGSRDGAGGLATSPPEIVSSPPELMSSPLELLLAASSAAGLGKSGGAHSDAHSPTNSMQSDESPRVERAEMESDLASGGGYHSIWRVTMA